MGKIENLVFKGGGVLGAAYAGAIMALEKENKLNEVKAVAGTSAGALVALLLSLKYSADDIKEIVYKTNFADFKDRWNPLRIRSKYGLYKGDKFLSKIRSVIEKKTNNANITYAQLASLGYRDLKVFSTDLNTSNLKEFSNDKTPNVIVAESIRASISIPLFFKAWQFPNNNPDDHIYVDGGLVFDYPISAFHKMTNTIGFYLYSKEKVISSLGYNDFFLYLKLLYKASLNAQDIDFRENNEENKITVMIDDLGISSRDFKISQKQKERLYCSGKNATLKFLAK